MHSDDSRSLIPCPECGGSGFSRPGTGYDDVCDHCGGLRDVLVDEPDWKQRYESDMAIMQGMVDRLNEKVAHMNHIITLVREAIIQASIAQQAWDHAADLLNADDYESADAFCQVLNEAGDAVRANRAEIIRLLGLGEWSNLEEGD